MKTKAMSLIATVLLAASTVEAVSYVDQLDEAQEVTPVPKKKTETLAKSAAATTQSATRFPNAMLGYWCFNHCIPNRRGRDHRRFCSKLSHQLS
jgi:hypothetical protein